jgi:hypothetical protein
MTLVTSTSYICSWISDDFVLAWTEMCDSCRFMNAELTSAVVWHKNTIHICDKTSFTYAGLSWYWKVLFSSAPLSYHKEGFYKGWSEVLSSSLPPLTRAVTFNRDCYEVQFSGWRRNETSLLIQISTSALDTTPPRTFMSCRTLIQMEGMMSTPDITSAFTIDCGVHHIPNRDITPQYKNRER